MHNSKSGTRPKTAREIGIMQGFPPPPEKRPSLENWDLAPFNRWTFQNMRSLFPTVDVRPGPDTREFKQAHRDLLEIEFQTFDEGHLSVAAWLTESYTDGFLVLKGDQIIAEIYANDFTPDATHLGQSVSKSLIGSLAGVLHGEGKLDLLEPLENIVPELAATGYAGCTVDQALDMLSGVRFTEDYGLLGSDMTRVDVASGWRPVRKGEIKPTIRDVILTLRQERPHGQAFSYRSIETDVIAWALERVSGEDLASLLSNRIWQKIGCAHSGFFTVDDAKTALADGGFNATLRDYARFGRMMADGGKVGGQQVVPASWVSGICSGADPSKHGDPYDVLSPQGAYRRFWWVHDPGRGMFMARGVFGQLIFIDQTADVVIVKLSSWPDYLIQSYSHDAVRACEAISRVLG
ncbi:serine hydrolase domain-containing protein [Falsiruegeria mediterranea]|uniref:6-aminohexanoate-dimer hydrolase n=1 Tax=Falsiruegeria mediterranea M17 TaxID=1200281 RepID=A0A2R8CDV0_9RHOB|nr:serine hydrolase [Falsiruegeria mediterranea]SPJ30478.1 6-aminohexanoate-dimer hydrolase [Falsiruegeria mediterranea M17]